METVASREEENDGYLEGLEYPNDMVEVDEFFSEENKEEDKLNIMKLLMEPPLPRPIPLGKIIEDGFGFYKKINEQDIGNKTKFISDEVVKRYTLVNDNKLMIQVINYGATVTAIRYPGNDGREEDVLMGFDNMEGYLGEDNPKFGGALGRYSNYISDSTGKIDGNEFFLKENRGFDHVYGGEYGFDKVLWDSYVDKGKVVMTYTSADKEEGYPGTLQVQITFRLSSSNQLIVHKTATCSKPTPLSVGHNLYFNLAGHGTGEPGLKQHVLLVNADRWLVCDPTTGKPTGHLQNVGATYFDLRVPRPVAKVLSRVPGGGYNSTFALTKGFCKKALTFAARLVHPESGRFVEVYTDYPSLHVSTSNNLPNPGNLWGKHKDGQVKEKYDLDFLCDDTVEGGDWMWPRKVMPENYPRPPSVPEEEFVFRRASDMTPAQSATASDVFATTESMIGNRDGSEPEEKHEAHEELNGEHDKEEEQAVTVPLPPRPILGKGTSEYRYHGAIAFVAEEFPDPFLHKRSPRPFIYPGDTYSRTTIYKFGRVPPRSTKVRQSARDDMKNL